MQIFSHTILYTIYIILNFLANLVIWSRAFVLWKHVVVTSDRSSPTFVRVVPSNKT